MDKPRPCGCKGCRSCLICEAEYGIKTKNGDLSQEDSYFYCYFCNKAYPGWDKQVLLDHPHHNGEPLLYSGVYIQLNFLSEQEEKNLLKGIDEMPWDLSQSGRRKQNFGPKCNFKKNKLKLGEFNGFPKFTKFVQDQFESVEILKGFQTIEQCSLEYSTERGASIDPHVDDCWIWGERVVTVNLLSDSVLTMTYNDKPDRYNLNCVDNYPMVLNENGKLNKTNQSYRIKPLRTGEIYPIIRIPMPRRSLLVIYNSARYDWEHQVLREDITERRVCLAYREFTPPYLPYGSKEQEGEDILEKAKHFWDHLIQC